MSFKGADVSPEKKTGFTYQGKEIILSKTRGAPMHGIEKKQGWYPDEKRIEVATIYAVTGSKDRTGALTGVPVSTIGGWIHKTWFRDLLEAIRAENDYLIDAKTTEIVNKSLEAILDRIDNGDYAILRDGTLVRKPVGAKDLSLVTAINIDKRQLLRGKPTSRSEQIAPEQINKKLEDLAASFRKIASRPIKELDIQDAEIISEADKSDVEVITEIKIHDD